MKGSFYGIAVEGWPFVLLALAATAWSLAGPWPLVAVPAFALFIAAVMKFRDPERETSSAVGVLSPVDGAVGDIRNGPDGTLIVLRIALFGPYMWRCPTEGKVLEGGTANGGHGLRIRTDEGEEVGLRLSGPGWLPPAAVIDYGERVGQGQRGGVLRAACRFEILLPPGAVATVQPGDKVRAGKTLLGRFGEETPPGPSA